MPTEQFPDDLPIDEVPVAEQSIEEAAPAEIPEPEDKPKSKDPVPYDRFRAVNKEKKWLRKQVQELQNKLASAPQHVPPAQASAPAPEPEPVDPKVAAVDRMVSNAAAKGVKPYLDKINEEVASLKAERQFERAASERETFWADHSEDAHLKQAVENRFNNMVQMAVAAGQKPLFTREDIYNYELGLNTRESRAKQAQSRQNEAAVKKAALGVVGARPGAQRPAPKSIAEKSADELKEDPDFSSFQF